MYVMYLCITLCFSFVEKKGKENEKNCLKTERKRGRNCMKKRSFDIRKSF